MRMRINLENFAWVEFNTSVDLKLSTLGYIYRPIFTRRMRKTEISRSLREIQRSEILLEILKSFVYRRAEESLPGPESNGANFYVVLTSSMCACA